MDPVNSVGEVFNPPTRLSWTAAKISWIQHKVNPDEAYVRPPFSACGLEVDRIAQRKKEDESKRRENIIVMVRF